MRLVPEPLRSFLWRRAGAVQRPSRPLMRTGSLASIFIAGGGGAPMHRVESVEAVSGAGLRGDRYSNHVGHWSPLDECQVTLVAAETLDEISDLFGVSVHEGEHRRNLVTRGIDLVTLYGRTFTVGEAVLVFDRPRPPCQYIASITEPGMTRALGARRGGICARVVESGVIRVGDQIAVC
jgi:MOSC domain-containing protein YiiM